MYRFRYDVYVEELGRYRATADHARRRLADPEDARSWNIYATAGGEVVGIVPDHLGRRRLLRAADRAVPAGAVPRRAAARGHGGRRADDDLTQLAGHRRLRRPRRGLQPASPTAHDVRIVFGACEPHLISFYARHQRPYGTRNINSPDAGFLIPLVSFPRRPRRCGSSPPTASSRRACATCSTAPAPSRARSSSATSSTSRGVRRQDRRPPRVRAGRHRRRRARRDPAPQQRDHLPGR